VWVVGFVVGLDLGFGHGGEPRVMVGYTLQLGYGYKIGFNLL
jgi:hypothetical protein